MKSREVYVNAKQQEFLQGEQRRKTFNGGRGSGKTTTIGFSSYLKMRNMPKAKSFLAGPTYAHLLNQTIPAFEEGLKILGLSEYTSANKRGHYTICRTPPPHFLSAYQEPRKYDNVISFINGYRIVLLSEDVGDRHRGGSYDSGDVDESALIKRDFINKVCLPMIRGNLYRPFSDSYLHHSLYDFTSAPWSPEGSWIYETENLMKENPSKALFVEATALDNLEVLGSDYIENQRKELSTLEFDVEIMNRRLKKLPNTFYPEFNEEQHTSLFTYEYDQNESGIYIKGQKDYDPERPLKLSFDFNAAINSCVVAQQFPNSLRVSNCFYNKYRKIDDLAETIAKHYENKQKNKIVEIYGDRMGKTIAEAATNKSYYDIISQVLKAHGFIPVIRVVFGNIEHKLKYYVVNAALQEKIPRLPKIRINANTCKPLILSIKNSPMKDDYQKDKSSEQKKNLPQENATHLSDAFDYLVYPIFAPAITHHASQAVGEAMLL